MRMRISSGADPTVGDRDRGVKITLTDDTAKEVADQSLPPALREPAAALAALQSVRAGKAVSFYGLPKWFEGAPELEVAGAVAVVLTAQAANPPPDGNPAGLHRAAVHTALAKYAIGKNIPIRWVGKAPERGAPGAAPTTDMKPGAIAPLSQRPGAARTSGFSSRAGTTAGPVPLARGPRSGFFAGSPDEDGGDAEEEGSDGDS